jgi:hypothetical protein
MAERDRRTSKDVGPLAPMYTFNLPVMRNAQSGLIFLPARSAVPHLRRPAERN